MTGKFEQALSTVYERLQSSNKTKIKGNISENVTIMEASLMKTRQDAWTKKTISF